MPTTPLRSDLTKVSYILPKSAKPKLARAAKRAGMSLSGLITYALTKQGILPKEPA